MRKTRNLIVLNGEPESVSYLIQKLQFKGITSLTCDVITKEDIENVFKNNKSVLCTGQIPKELENQKIEIWTSKKEDRLYIDITRDDVIEQFEEIVEKLGMDIGDHKSESIETDEDLENSECAYCNYLNGNDDYNNAPTVYRSKYFFVIPTIGQFINGYLLIIPYRHVLSYAELNNEERIEFLEVLSDVKELIHMTYGKNNFIVWEHGTGNGGKGKSKDAVTHAHMHVAPAKITNADFVQEKLGTEMDTISYNELFKYGQSSYLLIEDGENWKIIDNPDFYIPRQYVRQVHAEEFGYTDGKSWNWRLFPFYDKTFETAEDIKKTIKIAESRNELSHRILQNTRVLMK